MSQPLYIPVASMRSVRIANHNMVRIGSHNRVVAIATCDGRAQWTMMTKDSDKCAGRGLINGVLVGLPGGAS